MHSQTYPWHYMEWGINNKSKTNKIICIFVLDIDAWLNINYCLNGKYSFCPVGGGVSLTKMLFEIFFLQISRPPIYQLIALFNDKKSVGGHFRYEVLAANLCFKRQVFLFNCRVIIVWSIKKMSWFGQYFILAILYHYILALSRKLL